MNEIKIKVSGMNCNHCKINVENSLMKIEGIKKVMADIMHGEVTLMGENINLDQVKSSVEDIGYLYGGKLA